MSASGVVSPAWRLAAKEAKATLVPSLDTDAVKLESLPLTPLDDVDTRYRSPVEIASKSSASWSSAAIAAGSDAIASVPATSISRGVRFRSIATSPSLLTSVRERCCVFGAHQPTVLTRNCRTRECGLARKCASTCGWLREVEVGRAPRTCRSGSHPKAPGRLPRRLLASA